MPFNPISSVGSSNSVATSAAMLNTKQRPIPRDYLVEVSKGNVDGSSIVCKFGSNPDIQNAITYEDIWDGGSTTDWAPPTIARLHNLVSTDVADDVGGAGAEIVEVQGLDSAYALQTENVDLNGTSNVATANTYTMIHRMRVMQSNNGANDTYNVGNITATAQTDGTITAQISVGNNQTLMAIYQIPASKTGYLAKFWGTLSGKSSANVSLRLWTKGDNEPWQLKETVEISGSASSIIQVDHRLMASYGAKTIIKMDASSDTNSTGVGAGFDLLLVDN